MKTRYEINNLEIAETAEKSTNYLLIPTGKENANYKVPTSVNNLNKIYIADEPVEYSCVEAGKEINTPVVTISEA